MLCFCFLPGIGIWIGKEINKGGKGGERENGNYTFPILNCAKSDKFWFPEYWRMKTQIQWHLILSQCTAIYAYRQKMDLFLPLKLRPWLNISVVWTPLRTWRIPCTTRIALYFSLKQKHGYLLMTKQRDRVAAAIWRWNFRE